MVQNQVVVYLSLGSNQGDVLVNLDRARQEIACLPEVSRVWASKVYFTEPQELKEQPWFANQVLGLEVDPDLNPLVLLGNLQQIENDQGRVREVRFGPRSIDLDILLFGDRMINEPDLIVPHPRMSQRAFVLVPLLELAPGLKLPGGKGIPDLLSVLVYQVKGDRIWQV